MKSIYKVILTCIIGIGLAILISRGNPPNMGICILCFTRDIAGGLGLHNFEMAQYIRPEILGLILGSALSAIVRKRFTGLSGSISVYKFIFGFWSAIGAMVFLGCPLRLLQRLGGGDGTALPGAVGFILGVWIGMLFEKYNYQLPESLPSGKHTGIYGIVAALTLLVLLFLSPRGIRQSVTGVGSLHAPVYVSLAIAVVIGILLQLTGFCLVSMARGILLTKKRIFLYMGGSLLIGYILTTYFSGRLNIGFSQQPIAHSDYFWSVLSMALVGLAGALGGGCPMRQIIMTGEGNTDAFSFFLGMLIGTAIAHNFFIVSIPAGTTPAGKLMVVIGLLFCCAVALMQTLYVKKLSYEEIIKRY